MASDLAWAEAAARLFERPAHRWDTALDLACAVTPDTIRTPALEHINAALADVEAGRCRRLIISMPPQEGKSTLVTTGGPLWFLTRNPDRRIAIVSYDQDLADEFGRAIRNHILSNDGDEGSLDLGLRIAADNGAARRWRLDGHKGGVRSVGMQGGLTGRPVDALFIDDPISNQTQADSPTIRERAWQWWQTVGSTRLAPRAPVILVLTRWHEDDLAGRLLAAEDGHLWRVVSIPAQAETENDPLGRELGEFMQSARTYLDPDTGLRKPRSVEEWQEIKTRSTTRTWAALYQQRPAPIEGAVWKGPWIDVNRGKTGDVWQNLARVVVSVDPAAKSKRSSDYTGIVVVGLDNKGHGWVLDDRTLRGTPAEWAMAAWDALLDWHGTDLVIEDNQGGEMVQEVMRTAWLAVKGRRRVQQLAPKVTPVTSTQSKRTRAEAVAAYYETGRVHHAADGTDRLSSLETQMLTWTGTGDSPDRVDALVHGLTALFMPQHSADGMRPRSMRRAGARSR